MGSVSSTVTYCTLEPRKLKGSVCLSSLNPSIGDKRLFAVWKEDLLDLLLNEFGSDSREDSPINERRFFLLFVLMRESTLTEQATEY